MTVAGRPAPRSLLILALPDLPEVVAGDDLAAILVASCRRLPGGLQEGDVLAVSSKLVSKAQDLRTPWDGDRDRRETVVRSQTLRVVAERATAGGVTRVVESVAGPVMAAAGVDASNTGPQAGLLTLPADPDGAAADLRAGVLGRTGLQRLGVLLTDTAGRPWRAGQTDLALGLAGLCATDDLRGATDHDGRALSVTARAVADELAAAADLVKGKADGVGAVVVRGLPASWTESTGHRARDLVRTGAGDWFALGHVEAVRAALGVAPGSEAAAQIGIRPPADDGLAARAHRAARLAAHGVDGAAVHLPPTGTNDGAGCLEVRIAADDDLTLGRLLARLEAACAAEDLCSRWERVGSQVVVRVSPDPGPSPAPR